MGEFSLKKIRLKLSTAIAPRVALEKAGALKNMTVARHSKMSRLD